MSTPKNHHYISQGHIKNFFDIKKNEIHLYDKQLSRYFIKNSSKSIFSEKNLNTKRDNGGNYDYSSIEAELNQYFEKDFPRWCKLVEKFVQDLKFDDQLNNAMLSLAGYGIISEFRTPTYKRRVDHAIYNGMKNFMGIATDDLRAGFEQAFNFNDEVKYTNIGNYTDLANKILKGMGQLRFSIEIPANENDYFILGDFGAATMRERINDYFNLDAEDIAYVGLALSSKIYIHFFSNKLRSFPRPPGISYATSEQVYLLNQANFKYAQKLIACENQLYLKSFVGKYYRDR